MQLSAEKPALGTLGVTYVAGSAHVCLHCWQSEYSCEQEGTVFYWGYAMNVPGTAELGFFTWYLNPIFQHSK